MYILKVAEPNMAVSFIPVYDAMYILSDVVAGCGGKMSQGPFCAR